MHCGPVPILGTTTKQLILSLPCYCTFFIFFQMVICDPDHKKLTILSVFIPLTLIPSTPVHQALNCPYLFLWFQNTYRSLPTVHCRAELHCAQQHYSVILKPNNSWLQQLLNKWMWGKAYQILITCWISGNLHVKFFKPLASRMWFP